MIFHPLLEGIAFAFMGSGIVLGSICLLLVGVLTDYSLYLIVQSAERANIKTYQVRKINHFWNCLINLSTIKGLVTHCFGNGGFIVITILQFAFPFIGKNTINVQKTAITAHTSMQLQP